MDNTDKFSILHRVVAVLNECEREDDIEEILLMAMISLDKCDMVQVFLNERLP